MAVRGLAGAQAPGPRDTLRGLPGFHAQNTNSKVRREDFQGCNRRASQPTLGTRVDPPHGVASPGARWEPVGVCDTCRSTERATGSLPMIGAAGRFPCTPAESHGQQQPPRAAPPGGSATAGVDEGEASALQARPAGSCLSWSHRHPRCRVSRPPCHPPPVPLQTRGFTGGSEACRGEAVPGPGVSTSPGPPRPRLAPSQHRTRPTCHPPGPGHSPRAHERQTPRAPAKSMPLFWKRLLPPIPPRQAGSRVEAVQERVSRQALRPDRSTRHPLGAPEWGGHRRHHGGFTATQGSDGGRRPATGPLACHRPPGGCLCIIPA